MRTYTKNVCDKIETIFETNIINYGSTLIGGYHTELETSQLFFGGDISKYRMLIGCLNWSVTLCSFDVHYADSTIGRYQIAPK